MARCRRFVTIVSFLGHTGESSGPFPRLLHPTWIIILTNEYYKIWWKIFRIRYCSVHKMKRYWGESKIFVTLNIEMAINMILTNILLIVVQIDLWYDHSPKYAIWFDKYYCLLNMSIIFINYWRASVCRFREIPRSGFRLLFTAFLHLELSPCHLSIELNCNIWKLWL